MNWLRRKRRESRLEHQRVVIIVERNGSDLGFHIFWKESQTHKTQQSLWKLNGKEWNIIDRALIDCEEVLIAFTHMTIEVHLATLLTRFLVFNRTKWLSTFFAELTMSAKSSHKDQILIFMKSLNAKSQSTQLPRSFYWETCARRSLCQLAMRKLSFGQHVNTSNSMIYFMIIFALFHFFQLQRKSEKGQSVLLSSGVMKNVNKTKEN